MATRRTFLLVVFLQALLGCNPAETVLESEKDRSIRLLLQGTWYGSYLDDMTGDTVHWMMRLSPDGTESIRWKAWHSDGTITDYHESGKWYVTDGLFKLKYEVVDGERLNALEGFVPFRIVSVQADRFEYRDEMRSTPTEFVVHRVDSSFNLDQVKTPAVAAK